MHRARCANGGFEICLRMKAWSSVWLAIVWGGQMYRLSKLFVTELTLSIFVIILAMAMFFATFTLPPPALEPIGPAAFPRAAASILIILAAIVMVMAMRRAATRETVKAEADLEVTPPRLTLLLISLAITIGYFLVMQMEFLGFRWATIAYAFILTMVLSDFRISAIYAAVFWALLLGLGVHWLFTRFLFVGLP